MTLHFPTPVYTCAHTHAHRHMCSRSHITHACVCMNVHMCTQIQSPVHTRTHSPTQTPTCTHIRMHAHIFTHVHTPYSMCIPVHTCTDCLSHAHPHACTHTHVHTQIPTLTHVPTGTHAYINLHRLPRPRACTHTCAHTHTPAHTVPVATYSASATTKEHDVSESLLTLLPLLRPCSRPNRDVVRRGRPAPGQYLELQSLALLHVSSC